MGLLIDVMEPASIASKLLDIGEILGLTAGDYRWYSISMELVGVERKSVTDFLASLSNGSLADELRRLREEVDFPILLIEGPITIDHTTGVILRTWYSGGKFKKAETGWRLNNLIPAIYDFCRTLDIMPFYSPSIGETAAVIRYIYSWDQDQYHTAIYKNRKHEYVIPSPAAVMLASLVGPKTAHSLLHEFRSLRGILTADLERLTKVDGIGPKTAQKILDALDQEYKDSHIFDLSTIR